MLRLFVAIDLPETWKRWIAEEQARLERAAPGYARWVAPAQTHLTLAFIGAYAADQLELLSKALDEACAAVLPFDLALGELGAFGPPSRPRVVWVGLVERSGRLLHLHHRVTAALRDVGVGLEERPFVGHVTLGRARQDADLAGGIRLRAALATDRTKPGPIIVGEVKLFQSVLRPSGPIYTPLATFTLGEGG